jgi:hypothetical protein
MAYGQIINDVVAVGAATVLNIPHTLVGQDGVPVDFCAFLVQDYTSLLGVTIAPPAAVPLIPSPRTFVTNKNPGGVATFDITNALAAPAGNQILSALLVSPHSVLDAGPIIGMDLGTPTSTRTAATTRRGRIPSYRSLHHITLTQAAPACTITHNLGTNNVLAFVQPTSDPVENTPLAVEFTPTVGAGTVTVTMTTVTGVPIVAPCSVTADVMIITTRAIGHSYQQHNPATLARLPSYEVANPAFATGAVVGAGDPIDVVHNLRGAIGISLFNSGAAALGDVVGIYGRADATWGGHAANTNVRCLLTTSKIAGMTGFEVKLRPYSMLIQ